MTLSHQYFSVLQKSKIFSDNEVSNDSVDKLVDRHRFYASLIRYLAPQYPTVPEEVLDRMALIAFSLLMSLLSFDKLLDEGRKDLYKFAYVNLENSTRMLDEMFPPASAFWNKAAAIKTEYFDSFAREASFSDLDCLTSHSFDMLCRGKSAPVELVILMLSEYSGQNDGYAALRESLLELHVGMQYVDDFRDFREDMRHGQRTLIYKDTVQFLLAQNKKNRAEHPDMAHKYMVLSGIGSKHCLAAAAHFRTALSLVAELPLADYRKFVEQELGQTLMRIERIEELRRLGQRRATLQYRTLETGRDVLQADVVEEAIDLASTFVLAERDADGFWRDFRTDNGLASYWPSAYICCQMLEAGMTPERLSTSIDNLLALGSNAFSFNEETPMDSDSASFNIWLHTLTKRTVQPAALAAWLAFNGSDGAWSTYDLRVRPREGMAPVDARGWTQGHACVSAVATRILAQNGFGDASRVARCVQQLLESQTADGRWRAYWWSSDVYATAAAIRALVSHDADLVRTAVRTAGEWLLGQQQPDGAWGRGSERPFYTALAVHALLETGMSANSKSLEDAVRWLMTNQTREGGWTSGRSLRVPRPDTMYVERVTEWSNTGLGYNTTVQEDRGAFTAATVVAVLRKFVQRRGGLA